MGVTVETVVEAVTDPFDVKGGRRAALDGLGPVASFDAGIVLQTLRTTELVRLNKVNCHSLFIIN